MQKIHFIFIGAPPRPPTGMDATGSSVKTSMLLLFAIRDLLFAKISTGIGLVSFEFRLQSNRGKRGEIIMFNIYLRHITTRLVKNLRTGFNEIFGGVGRGPRNNRLDFSGAVRITIRIQEFFTGNQRINEVNSTTVPVSTWMCDRSRVYRLRI